MADMDDSCQTLIDAVRAAASNKTPLRFRGGGSKDFYGLSLKGQMLDTRLHSGVISYEPSELVVTVRCGTPLAELEALLAEKGQCLAFEPPHFDASWLQSPFQTPQKTTVQPELVEGLGAAGQGLRRAQSERPEVLQAVPQPPSAATVGGMVASGLCGPSRANVGSVRDHVLGAHFINGKGELLQFGGQVMKNVAGYDISRLLAGSMGTLGLITQVSLKVLPIAPAQATVMFRMDETTALQSLHQWSGLPLPLNACNWVRDATSGAPQDLLFLRLRGAKAAVQSAIGYFAGFGGEHMDATPEQAVQIANDWQLSRNLAQPWFTDGIARGDTLWRLSVPATAAPLQVGDTFIDWQGALRWVFTAAGDTAHAARVQAAAVAAGGSATLFRGADKSRGWQFAPPNPALIPIAQRLKAACDPHGIFNPHRLYTEF